MIQGVVNDAYEAVVAISLQGPEGQTQDIEAVVNPGCSGVDYAAIETPFGWLTPATSTAS